MRLATVILLILFLPTSTFPKEKYNAIDIIEKFLISTGGVNKWNNLDSFKCSVVSQMDKNNSFDFKDTSMSILYSKKKKSIYTHENKSENLYTDSNSWLRKDFSSWRNMNHIEYASGGYNGLPYGFISYSLFFLENIKKLDLKCVEQEGTVSLETNDVKNIAGNIINVSRKFFFSKRNFLLTKIVVSHDDFTVATTIFDEYKTFDNYVISTVRTTIIHSNGITIGRDFVNTNVYTNIQFNQPIDESVFEMN